MHRTRGNSDARDANPHHIKQRCNNTSYYSGSSIFYSQPVLAVNQNQKCHLLCASRAIVERSRPQSPRSNQPNHFALCVTARTVVATLIHLTEWPHPIHLRPSLMIGAGLTGRAFSRATLKSRKARTSSKHA